MERQPLSDCTTGRNRSVPGAARQPSPRARHDPADFVIEPLYVLPRDGDDNGLATDGTLERSIAAIQRWFADRTGHRLRFRTGPVATVRVAETDDDIAASGDNVRDRVEDLLSDEGFRDPHRIYAVWYEGTSVTSCGGGAWPPDLIGHVAALYLQGRFGEVRCADDRFTGDGVTPEINEFKMLHEIVHTLGFVPERAPHHILAGHLAGDPTDLMYAAPDDPPPPPWQPSVIDPAHRSYFRTGSPHIPDLSRSIFLDPVPQNATPPPGWD
jgi:hypothetical protein